MKDKKKIITNPIIVAILAIICCFLWGSAFPCIKIGYSLFDINGTSSVILFAGIRFFLAGILVIIVGSILNKKILYPKLFSFKYVGGLSVFQTIIQYLFFYLGLANCSGVKSSLINSTSVFFAILVACFVFKMEKFTFKKFLGCLIGFAGIVIINLDGFDIKMSFTGEGFILISSLSYAISSCLIKKFSLKENTFTLSGYQFLLGGAILSAVGFITGGRIDTISLSGAMILLYLAFVSAAAYTLWGVLLKYNPPSLVAAFGFFTHVFGVMLSAWWLKEEIDILLCVLSLILVCGGVLIINITRSSCKQKS